MSNDEFRRFLDNFLVHVNQSLDQSLLKVTRKSPPKFREAIKYVMRGGKRLRPLLVYIVGMAYGANPKILKAPACAIEMIHVFSLVHDDLPAMDNDTLRRGKPTCHIAFDEATAILVGDALAVGAFQILNTAPTLSYEKKVFMSEVLSEVSGLQGLISGQYLDLHMSKNKVTRRFLEQMYLLKTGALIHAAVKLGAIAAGVSSEKEFKLLKRFSQIIGLAFQITDDILNIESTPNKLGKNVGTDNAHNKITYPGLVGVTEAKIKIKELWQESVAIIKKLHVKKNFLLGFTGYIMQRDF